MLVVLSKEKNDRKPCGPSKGETGHKLRNLERGDGVESQGAHQARLAHGPRIRRIGGRVRTSTRGRKKKGKNKAGLGGQVWSVKMMMEALP